MSEHRFKGEEIGLTEKQFIKIGKAELYLFIYAENPKGFLSAQAYHEVAKFKDELEKDQARFNWMIENKAVVHHKGSSVFLFYGAGVYQEDDFKTPREAIDAAMKEGIKNG